MPLRSRMIVRAQEQATETAEPVHSSRRLRPLGTSAAHTEEQLGGEIELHHLVAPVRPSGHCQCHLLSRSQKWTADIIVCFVALVHMVCEHQ